MPRKRNGSKKLPAVEIDDGILRTLDQAIPEEFRLDVTWSAEAESVSIEEPRLEDLLSLASQEKSIDAVGFEVFKDTEDRAREVYFKIWCGSDGCNLEYSAPDDDQVFSTVERLADTVAGVLAARRRLPMFRAAKIRLGKHPTVAWWRLLNWTAIIERVVTGVIIAIVMLVIGLAIG